MLTLTLAAATIAAALASAAALTRAQAPAPLEWRDVERPVSSLVDRVNVSDYRWEELAGHADGLRRVAALGAGMTEAALTNTLRQRDRARLLDDLAQREILRARLHNEGQIHARNQRTVRAVRHVAGVAG